MTAKAELSILGGGVIGFSIAYHLAKEGVPCQVIEMDSIASKASDTEITSFVVDIKCQIDRIKEQVQNVE